MEQHNGHAPPTLAPALAGSACAASPTSWLNDFGGGPRPWKFSWVINFQKAGTFFVPRCC